MAGFACWAVGPAKEGGALCHRSRRPMLTSEYLTVEQQHENVYRATVTLVQDAPTFVNMFARAEEVVRTETPAAYKAAELSMPRRCIDNARPA